jgi:hypothetical protein
MPHDPQTTLTKDQVERIIDNIKALGAAIMIVIAVSGLALEFVILSAIKRVCHG